MENKIDLNEIENIRKEMIASKKFEIYSDYVWEFGTQAQKEAMKEVVFGKIGYFHERFDDFVNKFYWDLDFRIRLEELTRDSDTCEPEDTSD